MFRIGKKIVLTEAFPRVSSETREVNALFLETCLPTLLGQMASQLKLLRPTLVELLLLVRPCPTTIAMSVMLGDGEDLPCMPTKCSQPKCVQTHRYDGCMESSKHTR